MGGPNLGPRLGLPHAGSPTAAHGLSSCRARPQWLQFSWDPSSPTSDQIHIPRIARRILNHRTTEEVPSIEFLNLNYYSFHTVDFF